jgi:hypothetical protein
MFYFTFIEQLLSDERRQHAAAYMPYYEPAARSPSGSTGFRLHRGGTSTWHPRARVHRPYPSFIYLS